MFSISVLGNKNHSIYSVFWTAPSPNTGIYAVVIMLQEIMCSTQKFAKPVNYRVLGMLLGFVVGGAEGAGSQNEQ